jgi:uncharacterized protein YoxC
MLSDTVILALIAAVAPMITIIITYMLSGKKLDHIVKQTNSTLTAANKRIEELLIEVDELIKERDNK